MTGNTSRRQWMPWRVRTLLALILTLGMLIPVVSAYAQEEPTPVPVDKICVEGSVINFDETALGDDYIWTITYGPTGGTETFTVTTDEDGKFKLESGDGSPLGVGIWTFSINPLPSPADDGPWEGITSLSFDVPLKYGSTACAQIRWKMVRYVPVIVTKIDDQHNPLNDWVIRAEPAKGNWFASPQEVETGSSANPGEAVFRLTEGAWNFKERAPSGVSYTPILPSSGQQSLQVEWQGVDGQGNPIPQTLRFKNRVTEHGCIDVYKYDVFGETSTPLPGWKMTVKRTNGTVVATGYTDGAGKVTFSNLPFGPYEVYEELRSGWAPASPTGFTVTVTEANTDADTCAVAEFYNEQDFGYAFVGRKIDDNGHIGLPDWAITIKPLSKGGALPISGSGVFTVDVANNFAYATTDGLGNYRFDFATNDYRVPGAGYKVCEEMKSGWLPHTSTCYNVYLPKKPGSPVKVWDFVNQQVGHTETKYYGSSSGGSGCRYTVTVQPGDSLYGIGAYYGVSASAMLAANPWVYNRPHYYVYPGDTVCVP